MKHTHPFFWKAFARFSLVLWLATIGWTDEIPSRFQPKSNELLRHVRFLASDELLGRGVDTSGIEKARDYIAHELKSYGVLPAGDNGSYFQSLSVDVGVKIKEPGVLRFNDSSPLALNQEWIPLGLSRSGEAEEEIVFAGYGITAKDYGYDDYAGIDVKGKTVLILRYEPPPKTDKSPFRKRPGSSNFATLRYKATNAREHGASAMILVDLDPRDGEAELISLARSLWRTDSSLIAAQVKREIIERLLTQRDVSIRDLKEKIDREEKPFSMALPGLRASLKVDLERITRKTDNVIAVLPGSDPRLKDEHIVIGAHYDHLGYGHFGTRDTKTEGQIHNGADDNASGTAVLLNLARRLSLSRERPARSLVFVFFTGEELGLYGSRYYVTHPPSPLESIKAMINLDMIGRMKENRITAFGVDTAKEFADLLNEISQKSGIEVRKAGGTGRSDHASFYSKNIPVLHFSTGTHEDYHRPTDDWEKLNIEGMEKIGDLVLSLVNKLSAAPDLNFVRSSSAPATYEREGENYGAYLGIIPDFAEQAQGIRLAGVRQGSPAEAAGLQEGDVIVQFAERKVKTLEDLTTALRSRHPGEKVEISALRQGKLITLQATLRSRTSS
ncbi:MAG: M20/M25/M40 family metallo-hydrolase [Deltaproteobacteria bacterium]|nr:M20/M25/M40 family metallo-hydrolase [Deltaproteobacteria bacterium]